MPETNRKGGFHMENRDRDKNQSKTSTPSQNIGKSKGDSNVEFGKNIKKSEDLGNESSRREGSVGSSGMKSDSGRNRGSNEYGDEGLGSSDVGSKSDEH